MCWPADFDQRHDATLKNEVDKTDSSQVCEDELAESNTGCTNIHLDLTLFKTYKILHIMALNQAGQKAACVVLLTPLVSSTFCTTSL